jgi:uncharacterized membrane protein YgcG
MATNQQVYELLVKTNQAVQNLNSLQNNIKKTSDAFGGLKNAIAGIAVGAIIRSLLTFADGIQDLSDATGIATANLVGFQKAVSAFGGNAEIADKAVLRLVTNIGGAADGSSELQYAFGRVGVSLQDLATLSEADILKKTIDGLGKITNQSEQALLKQQLLGKEFRNVATSGLGDAYEKASADSIKYQDAIKNAADVQDKLNKAISDVKMTMLGMINETGILKYIQDLSVDSEKLKTVIQLVGIAFATYFGAALAVNIIKIVETIASLTKAVVALDVATMAAGGKWKTFLDILLKVGKAGAAIGLLTFSGDLNSGEDEQIAKIKKLEMALGSLTNTQKEAYQKLSTEDKRRVNDQIEAGKTADEAMKLIAGTGKQADTASGGVKKLGEAVRNIIDPFKGMKEALKGSADDFARLNKNTIDNIILNTSLVGVARQEAEIRKANADITQKEEEAIRKLTDTKAKLTKEQQAAGLGGIIDGQIKLIQQQAEADRKSAEEAIKNSEARINARKLEEYAIKEQINLENEMIKIQDEMAKSTLSEIEKKEYEIVAAAKARAKAEIEAEEARRGSKLSVTEAKAYYDAAIKGTKDLVAQQRAAYDDSRKFSTGWKQALNEYVDNATNAANRARSIFQKATQGMEDLIVNFAKTGKFEWKNFVAMMLEELLRAQIQQIFAQLMTGMKDSMGSGGGGGGGIMSAIGGLFGMGGGDQGGGGGGIMDAIGSIFGMGGGGGAKGSSANNPMYVIDVSGGGGGGMGGILGGGAGGGESGGIWGGIKDVFGGVADSIGGVFSGIGDAIGGLFGGGGPEQVGGPVDSGGGFFDSIGSLFDGWFAGGGQIGAGKFGIVGENGPELVGGPANVSPMGGGTNVTYNINAVDAMSFKQMLAQDPSFIYALSMQGGGGIPSRR